jgi:hypothetical protein
LTPSACSGFRQLKFVVVTPGDENIHLHRHNWFVCSSPPQNPAAHEKIFLKENVGDGRPSNGWMEHMSDQEIATMPASLPAP